MNDSNAATLVRDTCCEVGSSGTLGGRRSTPYRSLAYCGRIFKTCELFKPKLWMYLFQYFNGNAGIYGTMQWRHTQFFVCLHVALRHFSYCGFLRMRGVPPLSLYCFVTIGRISGSSDWGRWPLKNLHCLLLSRFESTEDPSSLPYTFYYQTGNMHLERCIISYVNTQVTHWFSFRNCSPFLVSASCLRDIQHCVLIVQDLCFHQLTWIFPFADAQRSRV